MLREQLSGIGAVVFCQNVRRAGRQGAGIIMSSRAPRTESSPPWEKNRLGRGETRRRVQEYSKPAPSPSTRRAGSSAMPKEHTARNSPIIRHAFRSVSLWTLSLCVRPSLWRLSSSPRKRAAGTVGFPASGESFEGASCVFKSRLKSPCLRNNHHHTH